jgi:hypothetical protein
MAKGCDSVSHPFTIPLRKSYFFFAAESAFLIESRRSESRRIESALAIESATFLAESAIMLLPAEVLVVSPVPIAASSSPFLHAARDSTATRRTKRFISNLLTEVSREGVTAPCTQSQCLTAAGAI